MKKILLILSFIFAFTANIFGQTGQIGAGTATSTTLPINSCWGYNYSQQIYTAAEMTAAVGTNTFITSIKFFVSATASDQNTYNNWTVYMGNTAQNDFATATSWVPLANMQQVYTGTLPTMTNGAWVEIPLATPFIWDGTSNLVISVDENAPNYSCTQSWGSYTAGTNRGILYYSDGTNPNPASPPSATSRYSPIPRVQFVSYNLQPCSIAPPTGITVGNLSATTATVSWTPATGATYVLRYRTLPGGAWTTVPITTPLQNTYAISGLTELTNYEVQIATICGGTQGAFSTAVPFTTPAIAWCSNSPQYTGTFYGFISNVTVNPIGSTTVNNPSAASQYTDYSANASLLVTLVRGTQNNPITIGKTWSGTPYANYAQVWIDFDRSGTFEANEKVYDSGLSAVSPLNGSFNVPLVTYNGPNATKMRVILSYAANATACAGVNYGEIEDYAVKFIDPAPCTSAAPTGLVASNVTPSTATISWMPALGATYLVQWRKVTNPAAAWTTIVPNPTVSTATLSNLEENVQYEFRVAYICSGVTGTYAAPVQFTTPVISYCTANPLYTTTLYEYLSNVTVVPTGLASMVSNSPTPPPYYTDYTNDATRQITLIRGTANNSISATKVWPNFQYASGTRAWIDFNRNGIFGDVPNELILDSPSNTTAVVNNTNFSVPTVAMGAYAGTLPVRMRIILQESGSPVPCGTFGYGEVEDYNVRLIDLQPCTTAAPTPITVSNLTATTAYVTWLPAANATYRVRWRQVGTTLWQQQPLGYVQLPAGQSYYTITGLIEQTNYEVQVLTICNGTTGAYGTSVPFTTPPLTYCPMIGGGTNDYISNVKVSPVGFNVVDNTSLQTNYILYNTPATLINLEIGSIGNQISVGKGWVSGTFSDAVYAYIDYNRDGIFADSERILTSAASTVTPVTATFNVPLTGVYTGPYNTTMRVVLNRTSAPTMCASPATGEVEDYYVKLRPCSNVAPSAPTFNTITHTSAIVNWVGATNNLNYILQYRPLGSTTWVSVNVSTLAGNPPITLAGLTPATTYQVQVAAVCGNAPGTYTPIRTFTTRCDPTPPNVVVSNVTANSALVTWNPVVPSATYVLRWREVGTALWTTVAPNFVPPVNSYTIAGLTSFKTYEVQVANQCVGETTINSWSNPQVFTTVRLCEVPPPGLTITQLTPTTAEVTWGAFPGATYILRYRKVGIPSWTNIPVPTNTYTITGLLELNKYEMQVVNVCSGTPGNYTPPYFFTTPTIIYCQMSATTSATEYINKVTVTPNGKPKMENISVASNYTDYTGNNQKFIELIQGSSDNKITVDKTLSSGSGVAVWIDFNRNGYFDLNERIMADGPNTNATSTATFTVPADAFVSMTDYKYVVMRVAMQKGGIPVNCTNFQSGEVEDYTVRISKQAVPSSVNQTDILIYPNPVSTVLYVKNISKKANYKIYSTSGQLVSNGLILNNKIDVSRLINGLYVIDIEDVQGIVQKKFIKE